MKPTITAAEANRLVDDYSSRVREALPADAEYELFATEHHGDCSDPSDHGPAGRVIASRTYQVRGLPSDRIPSYFDALRAWWQNHNFRILDNEPPNEYLWVENNADGFRMTLQANPAGELFVVATSPCVWSNGTPEPSAAAAGQVDAADVALAASEPRPAVTRPEVSTPPPAARRAPAHDEDIEDFDQRDWTDESTY